jgi:streptogrisin C
MGQSNREQLSQGGLPCITAVAPGELPAGLNPPLPRLRSCESRGFVTAGHCGGVGTTTYGFNGVTQGTVRGSSFPGNDYTWVQSNPNWASPPWVNSYLDLGGNILVTGSQEAVTYSSVCRSGSTTGWRCGSISAKNVTVNYSQGSVFGLTRTTACAEPGDSGGSWLTGNQAQGVTSGGSGNCTSGGTTYFQPINPILNAYGLTLMTAGYSPIVNVSSTWCWALPSAATTTASTA